MGATDRTRVGDQEHLIGRRIARQNDGRRLPNLSEERHLRVRLRSVSTLAVGRCPARSEPGDGGHSIGREQSEAPNPATAP
jgi:hypothetical protein